MGMNSCTVRASAPQTGGGMAAKHPSPTQPDLRQERHGFRDWISKACPDRSLMPLGHMRGFRSSDLRAICECQTKESHEPKLQGLASRSEKSQACTCTCLQRSRSKEGFQLSKTLDFLLRVQGETDSDCKGFFEAGAVTAADTGMLQSIDDLLPIAVRGSASEHRLLARLAHPTLPAP